MWIKNGDEREDAVRIKILFVLSAAILKIFQYSQIT